MTHRQRTFYVNDTTVEGSTPLQACKSYVETLKPKKSTFSVVLEDATNARKYHYKVYVKSNGKIICKIDKQAGGVGPCQLNLTVEPDCKIKVKIDVLAEEHEKAWVQKWLTKIEGYKKSICGVSKYLIAVQYKDSRGGEIGKVTELKKLISETPTTSGSITKDYVDKVLDHARKCADTLKKLQNMVDLEKIVNDVVDATKHATQPIKGIVTHNINNNNIDNCNFVVVTYWWGKGNDNKNLQFPCPEDATLNQEQINDFYGPGYYEMMDKRRKPTKKFETMIEDWRKSCEGYNLVNETKTHDGCYHLDIEYPQFAQPGMYQLAINAKPLFIKKALEICRQKFQALHNQKELALHNQKELALHNQKEFTGVVYIDGDMTVNKFPAIFNMKNVDMMARGWNIDPRSAAKAFRKGVYDFDPYVFETSGGIMFFGNTETAIYLLKVWHRFSNMEFFRGKADDRILSMLITRYGFQHSANIIQLPIEYLWLTDSYGEKEIHSVTSAIKPGDVVGRLQPDITGDIIFEHPACLTGEERASDQGASANRSPPLYEDLVTGKIRDKYHGGIFYNNIIFDPKAFTIEGHAENAAETFSVYLRQLSRLGDEDEGDIPPYYIQNDYGRLQSVVAKKEIQDAFTNICPTPTPPQTSPLEVTGDEPNIISTIIATLNSGQDVVYIQQGFSDENKTKALAAFANSEIELAYFSTIPKGKHDEIHFKMSLENTPIFFSSRSLAVRHLLLMSESIFKSEKNKTNICDIFNSSYLFSSLIRTCVIYEELWTPNDLSKTITESSPVIFTIRNYQKLAARLSELKDAK